MRGWKTIIGMVGAALLLAACSANAPAQADPQPTAEATLNLPTETSEPLPTATSTVEVAEVDYCVECHTDKDQLISTAKIEEEAPKESEGAG